VNGSGSRCSHRWVNTLMVPGSEPVADRLQRGGVLAGGEPVGQRGEPEPGLAGLALGPLVPVAPLRCRRDYAEPVGMADSGFVQVVLVLPVLSA